LGDLGVALTRTEGRWILELLLSALLTSPRAFGGDPVAPVDEAVIQRTVHETTRDWTNEAFLSFLEPGFQRVGDGPRAVREAFLARIPPWAYPGEIRKAWGGPVLPVEDSPERVAEAAQREALALGRSVADRLVELQADAPRTATTKPDGTKVSRADEEAMVTLASGILEAFPTHEIIGEEDLEPLAPELHRRNRANAGSPYQWFIDPLDGTETYLGGTDIFAVHLELQHEGRPLLAVVVLLLLDDLVQFQQPLLQGLALLLDLGALLVEFVLQGLATDGELHLQGLDVGLFGLDHLLPGADVLLDFLLQKF
jgi:hypothetical protein